MPVRSEVLEYVHIENGFMEIIERMSINEAYNQV